ncbi:hypothetical protein PCYB_125220 [Plasmodium cynomolgi strain B]|uniref:Uncharacterized protein n=1 Tax=Plasmodium cynomolgi (strain B) TaxID=1120755 RepID=K6UE94_PLACD|nr:hypothetical protein PCYB_125220 [Plasmodium cynomolgi strain B]GAB67956.1 hypothetical protein PCYB_125220 [Plasmodium cynomolgi strain B]
MEKRKKKRNDDNARNVYKLKEFLANDENTSACVQCCERNSYETCNNILQYIKKDLNIPLYVLDLVSIYNHDNIAKFVKDVFAEFVNTAIPYYIHMNRNIHKRISKKKKFSIKDVCSVLSSKVDYFDSARQKNVNLFKCFFAYYYKFQRGVIRRSRKRRQRTNPELTNVNAQRESQNCKSLNTNFKWVNCLTNLKYFKYLRKYKYFLTSKKKKKFTIFFFTHNDTYFWKHISERLYSPFFIKEYICTLLKRHTKLSAIFKCSKGSGEGGDMPRVSGREDATTGNLTLMKSDKKYDAFHDNQNCYHSRGNCLHVEPDPVSYAKQRVDPTLMCSRHIRKGTNEDHLAPIRKRFILKNRYQRDDKYCVYNSQRRTLLSFYFSKINIPNICLIYGDSGVGKSTLLQFLVHIVSSNYKDISFSEKVIDRSLHSAVEGNAVEVSEGGSTNTIKQNMRESKSTAWGGKSYRHVSYTSLMRRMNHREKKNISSIPKCVHNSIRKPSVGK